MLKLLLAILFIAFISYVAVWFGNSDGKFFLEWFGWQINTTPSFFLILLLITNFFLYIFFIFLFNFFNLPKNTIRKIRRYKIQQAKRLLQDSIIASYYGNKLVVSKNLPKIQDSLKSSPLLMLLELQHSMFKNNDKNSFIILTKMLTIKSLQPLAVKGLINYSIKKKDLALFKNVLFKSLYKKFEFSWIEQDVYKFCLENNNWEILSEYLEKKKLPKNNVNKKIFSFVYYQLANGYYNNNKEDLAKKYLIKALNLNKYFPPFIELYCKIDLKKDKKELIKLLKNYWNKNPNPNIEKCINLAFTEKNNMSKLKISTMVITNNSHLYFKYLILGKFKYHAKLWGASKSDLKKSIENNPSREAYYYLHKIEDNINKNTNDSKKWHNLYKKTQDKYFWKCKSCGEKYINWNSFCISCKQINCITINSKSFEIRNYNSLENSARPYLRDFYK